MAAGARVVGAPVDREWGCYSGYVALAMVAEFEADLAQARSREGMAVASVCGAGWRSTRASVCWPSSPTKPRNSASTSSHPDAFAGTATIRAAWPS